MGGRRRRGREVGGFCCGGLVDDHDHPHHGHDNNLKSAYAHVIADALTSVLAIAALLAGRYVTVEFRPA